MQCKFTPSIFIVYVLFKKEKKRKKVSLCIKWLEVLCTYFELII